MRPSTGKILFMALAVLAALLAWLWWSDAVFDYKCERAGGIWDADARVCRIPVNPDQGSHVSRWV
ncbi:hypothetical protein [Stakelama marina]|uniref:Uncharacterized protein n=1 Tax=Stakelama marina TaxID=2826939 RepID=A0A8T4IP59_9SPHN|nr:hypothetical protein [Stakelama marina]MBR0553886.1 hypothetical protein [Stakelama marina]